ncbi:MAG: hypothetical protein ABFD08_19020 [Syntrophomonas sp.]
MKQAENNRLLLVFSDLQLITIPLNLQLNPRAETLAEKTKAILS